MLSRVFTPSLVYPRHSFVARAHHVQRLAASVAALGAGELKSNEVSAARLAEGGVDEDAMWGARASEWTRPSFFGVSMSLAERFGFDEKFWLRCGPDS